MRYSPASIPPHSPTPTLARARPGHHGVRPRAPGGWLVALLVVGWATAGGGAAKIGRLFDRVIDSVIDKV